MKIYILTFVIALLSIFIINGCDALYGPSSPVLQLTPSNLKSKVLNSNGVVLVEFFAPWCGHFKALTSIWEKPTQYLAMVLYHAGDMPGAIMHQHKELLINERCLGLDHPDTAHSYGNMALFYHGVNQPPLALQHMSRVLLLLSLSSGPDHPDVAATFINVAMMYQDIGKMNTALRYLQEALKRNERLLGKEHIQTVVCYHALAIAFNCMGAYKLSHQHEKKTYDILLKQLSENI